MESEKVKEFKRYEVSNLGRIRRIAYTRTTKCGKEVTEPSRMCNPKLKKNLSRSIVLMDSDGFSVNKRICDLVADAFIPKPQYSAKVHRKDGCVHNDRVDNLEWVSDTCEEEMENYIFFTEVREWENEVVIYGRLGVRHKELNGRNVSKIILKAKRSYINDCKAMIA